MSIVIAVDGPAAVGKGTLTRALAETLGFDRLDTGLLYRAVARIAVERGIAPDDAAACTEVAETLDVAALERDDLRGEAIGQVASKVAAIPGVRAALLDFQRRFASHPPGGAGAVLDGRDIGTVVCPEAELKLWLVADPMIRAERRAAESAATGAALDVAAIAASIAERDHREATRAVAPMKPAEDAVVIDTSHLTPGEVLEAALVALARAYNVRQALPARAA